MDKERNIIAFAHLLRAIHNINFNSHNTLMKWILFLMRILIYRDGIWNLGLSDFKAQLLHQSCFMSCWSTCNDFIHCLSSFRLSFHLPFPILLFLLETWFPKMLNPCWGTVLPDHQPRRVCILTCAKLISKWLPKGPVKQPTLECRFCIWIISSEF